MIVEWQIKFFTLHFIFWYSHGFKPVAFARQNTVKWTTWLVSWHASCRRGLMLNYNSRAIFASRETLLSKVAKGFVHSAAYGNGVNRSLVSMLNWVKWVAELHQKGTGLTLRPKHTLKSSLYESTARLTHARGPIGSSFLVFKAAFWGSGFCIIGKWVTHYKALEWEVSNFTVHYTGYICSQVKW